MTVKPWRSKLLFDFKFIFNGALVMKISLNWLRDYIEIERYADQIAEILNDLGLPYEQIEHLADDTIINIEVTSNRGDWKL